MGGWGSLRMRVLIAFPSVRITTKFLSGSPELEVCNRVAIDEQSGWPTSALRLGRLLNGNPTLGQLRSRSTAPPIPTALRGSSGMPDPSTRRVPRATRHAGDPSHIAMSPRATVVATVSQGRCYVVEGRVAHDDICLPARRRSASWQAASWYRNRDRPADECLKPKWV